MRVPAACLRRCLVIAAAVGAGAAACQNPDIFLRDAGAKTGVGGSSTTGAGGSGSGGSTTGAGGSGASTGSGGFTGTGGSGGSSTTGAGGSGGATGTGGATGAGGAGGMPCTACKVKISYTCRSDDTGSISYVLKIVNNSAISIPLGDLTVRYWYTADAGKSQELNCDYALLQCANVMSSFVAVTPAKTKANEYAQIAFGASAGVLDGFADTGEIQIRMHNSDYSVIDQTDDYSYDCTMKGIAVDSTIITAYVRGALVSGTEPP